jgi:type III pantothenate kinase
VILLIDIGNSNIVMSQYDGAKLSDTYRYKTDKTKTTDEYYVLLRTVMDGVTDVAISSVVPELNEIFKSIFEKYYHFTPLFISPGVKTGVKIKADNPKEVGADIVAAAAGAIHFYGDDSIVIDMGTATTITYIKDKAIRGVFITAGLVTQRDALIGGASQLSQFEFKAPKSILGTNTIDCLNAGLLHGHATMIEGVVNKIRSQYGGHPHVILTGGASRFIEPVMTDTSVQFEQQLVLRGLIEIYKKNRLID